MDEQQLARKICRCSRRSLLGAGMAMAFTGCVPDPTISYSTPQKSPLPTSLITAAQFEVDTGLSWRRLAELHPPLADYATNMTAMHVAHASVLLKADPLGGINSDQNPLVKLTPNPASAASDIPTTLAMLISRMDQIISHASARITAEPLGLIFASLTVSTMAAKHLVTQKPDGKWGSAPQMSGASPWRIPPRSEADIARICLKHLYLLRSACRTGIGVLNTDHRLRASLDARLAPISREIDILADRSKEQVAPLGLPSTPKLNSAESVSAFLMPFEANACIWLTRLAAANLSQREMWLAAATDHDLFARSIGAKPGYWPGWS